MGDSPEIMKLQDDLNGLLREGRDLLEAAVQSFLDE
jgi:hypothetical protein